MWKTFPRREYNDNAYQLAFSFMDTNILPPWYASTNGPGISATILNLIGNVLPIISMALSAKGIHFVPPAAESYKVYVDLAVFAVFSIRAAIGYVRAKRKLGAQIMQLQSTLASERNPR